MRAGVLKLLELKDDLEVVGEADNGRLAVALVKKLCPTVVVMDIAMPLLNGLEATRQILEAVRSARILIFSAHSDDAYVKNATEAGALGFLLKQTSAHVLSEGIREVNKRHICLGPVIAKLLPEGERKSMEWSGATKPRNARLTSREMEVLQLIAEGNANKEAAAELGIGIKTVEKHREHLMVKLNIHDTAGLTRYAINAGIVESSVQLTIVKHRNLWGVAPCCGWPQSPPVSLAALLMFSRSTGFIKSAMGKTPHSNHALAGIIFVLWMHGSARFD